MSTSPTASYTYALPGTYQVALTVTDATGAKSTTAQSIVVPNTGTNTPQPPVSPPSTGGGTNPTASIALTSQNYLGVTLSGAGSKPGSSNAAIVQYAWNFGDGTSVTNGSLTYGTIAQPFTSNSPFNIPIPANPALDPNNAALKAAVLNDGTTNIDGSLPLVVNMAIYTYGQPCYTSTPGMSRVSVSGDTAFGHAPSTVPWNPSWVPNSGADSKINIFDVDNHYVYEFDGFSVGSDGSLSTTYGVARDYVNDVGDGYPLYGAQNGPLGSGLDQVGGMIRVSDITSGSINHALTFLTSNPMGTGQTTDGTWFRYPASHSDGTRSLANGLYEGMRIQLDPTIDLASIPGITRVELMIGLALQKYGAYCSDNGGNNNLAMGFYCEKPTTTADPYPAVGVTGDWFQLSHIPRSGYRVLDTSVTYRGMTNPNTSAVTPTTSHSYASNGTYTTTLTVTDSVGNSGTATQAVTVAGKVNQPPVGSFTATASQLVASLDASASTDDGSIASYAWTFGDGATATLTSPSTTHTYSAAGTYTIKLIVTDNQGLAGAAVSKSLTVTNVGATQPTGSNITPIQNLVSQADNLSGQINKASTTNYVSFDNAKYTWSDFAHSSTDNYSGRGVDVGNPIGLLGSGIGKTVFEMVSGSTTKYTAPGPKSYMVTGETTNLHYMRVESQVKKLDGFTLQGVSIGSLSKRYDGSASNNAQNNATLASPYIYNGLFLEQLSNATVSNIHVNGIPGSDYVNPGESFALAFQHCSGMTFDTVTINGSLSGTDVGATGFGGNYHTGTCTITNCESLNLAYSAGIALYGCSGTVNITNFVATNNYRHLNFEQNTKGLTVNVHNPTLGKNLSGVPLYFGANSTVSGAGSIKFNMYDPVDDNGKAITSLVIKCNASYVGKTNLQARSDIKIYVGGKDKTSSIVTWE